MLISLTKRLADGMGIKPRSSTEEKHPLFSWTANWTKVWDNRVEDMLVLINDATRFTVAIYQVKRKDLKKVPGLIPKAIENTFFAMNLNPDIVAEYMRLAGEVEFAANRNRQTAAWVTKAGFDCAYFVGGEHGSAPKVFDDTVGVFANQTLLQCAGNSREHFYPYRAMFDALSNLTGQKIYKYRAFELLVTLDLDVYKAKRRIIVPCDLSFARLHRVLQLAFKWRNYHLYDFVVCDGLKPVVRLVPFEDDLEYDENAMLMRGHVLSEFLPAHKRILYTYDMGDNWEHTIHLTGLTEEYHKESPYLLEATGQTPPEDVGGVGGFVDFRKSMMDPSDPEHANAKTWAGYWRPELSDQETRPRLLLV